MNDIREIINRWKDLAKLAEGIIPNTLSLDPSPDEILSINKDLFLLARKVDALVESYAEHVIARTGHEIDDELTKDQLAKAIEGNLTYEIECAAEAREAEMMEAIYGDDQLRYETEVGGRQ